MPFVRRGWSVPPERWLYETLRRLARRADSRGARPRPEHLRIGEQGEDLAWFHLRQKGYTVVARRWVSDRMPGDLDLVAWDGETLVIVEVKARTRYGSFAAEAAVDAGKQATLRRMASDWMRGLPAAVRGVVPVRFDVLAVYLLQDGVRYAHFPGAFPAARPAPEYT